MNLLFVCSKNKWRSRTAETIFRNVDEHRVKSAGTDEGARVKLTEKMLQWADKIFVMEKKHRQLMEQKFQAESFAGKVIILEIPDEYQYMGEELVQILKDSVQPYL